MSGLSGSSSSSGRESEQIVRVQSEIHTIRQLSVSSIQGDGGKATKNTQVLRLE